MRAPSSDLGDGSPHQTLQLEESCGHWSALAELRNSAGIFEERMLAQSFNRILLRSYLKIRYKWIYYCFNFRTNEPSKSKPEMTIKAHPLNKKKKKKTNNYGFSFLILAFWSEVKCLLSSSHSFISFPAALLSQCLWAFLPRPPIFFLPSYLPSTSDFFSPSSLLLDMLFLFCVDLPLTASTPFFNLPHVAS